MLYKILAANNRDSVTVTHAFYSEGTQAIYRGKNVLTFGDAVYNALSLRKSRTDQKTVCHAL
jgi:hypothetical protein